MRRLALIVLVPALLRAHVGEAPGPDDLWTAWSFEPGIILPLAVTALLFARGSRHASRMQKALFWSGMFALAMALVSPLHPIGEVLFSAHMAQHEVLMLIAAPLLVLARPLAPLLHGMPLEWRRTAGRWSKRRVAKRSWGVVTYPLIAWWMHAAALWCWHIPYLFEATLRNEWVHAAQHLSFFVSALLFWWSLFFARGRQHYGSAVVYIFTTGVHTSILGALLTLSGTLWYPVYGNSPAAWGLTPLEDQQLGGLIMWVPAGLVYIGAALTLFATWVRESDAREPEKRFA